MWMRRFLLLLALAVTACGESEAPPHVGSTDCSTLAEVSIDLTLDECLACQGAACGSDATCDAKFPCVDGEILIVGCADDEDCQGVSSFCGRYTGTNDVCVPDDDV